MKQKLLNNLRLRAVWLVAMILCAVTGAWADEVTYKLTIDASSFNTTSYAANNNEKTSNAVCVTDNTKTFEVNWTSNQVMKSGTNMQWQKSKGVIYNSTDLGTITKVTVTSSAGSFTTYYGEEAQPSSSTTVGNGFFQIKVGGATGTVSLIEVTFTVTEGGDTNLEESNLALKGAPVALSFDLYNKADAQVIEYTTSSTGAVTVSSSEFVETSVDAGNKTITVTPVKKTSEAQTITVSQAADDTYAAGSATFTVTITDSTPKTGAWVLTDLADLTSEDVFVIVGNNGSTYALSNDKGTGSAPSAVAVTIENEEITSDVDDNIKWTISGNDTDGYTFYPNGDTEKWLYCTNTNNGVRVGTNDGNTFIISEDYLKHVATSRFVGIYNSSDWRCYTNTSGNIANQSFSFYKYEDNIETPSPRISANNVNIEYNITNGAIAFTVNNPVDGGVITAESSENWLTIGAVGENVPFTCSANDAATDRTASVTLTYTYNTEETVTKNVTVTQAGNPDAVMSIAEVREQGTGAVQTRGIVTSCVGTTGYIQDETAAICVYGISLNLGDEVKVSGTLTTYNGLLEITNPTVNVLSQDNSIAPEVMTIEEVNASAKQGWLVKIENATVTAINGQNTTIAQGNNSIVVRGISGVDYAVDDVISLTGNIGCYNTAQIANPANVTVQVVASISLDNNTIEATAEETQGTINVTYNNITDVLAEVKFYEADGTTAATYDWIEAEIDNSNNVYYVISANNGDARTAYMKVYALDDESNDIYSELITVSQEAYVAPVPSINASNVDLTYDATAGEIAYTITNPVQDVDLTAVTTADWISNITVTADKVTFTTTENEGNVDRQATITLSYTGAEDKAITVTQAHFEVDYANLPFEWEGGASEDLKELSGVTANSLGSDYASGNTPYLIKFDGTGDYIQVKTDGRPGVASIGIKMIGGASTSTITVQESSDGEDFSDVEELTISGTQNTVLELVTTQDFASDSRFVRFYFTKGSNVGVGPISITKYSSEPSIIAENVELTFDATSGEIAYTIKNPVESEELTASTEAEWISNLTVDSENNKVTFTTTANNGTERSATITLNYASISKNITVTQAEFIYAALPFIWDDNTTPVGVENSGVATYGGSPYMKFDGTGDYLILTLNEVPGTLTFDIQGNGFSGGTFKVQTSVDGKSYSDLETYTELTSTKQSQSFDLSSDVRYIKWIYTEKVSGNVALGNFVLTAPITVTLNDYGFATFASTYPLDFTNTSDYDSWQVTGVQNTAISFEKIESKVAAGTGVLLTGYANETITLTRASSGSALSGNKLQGITSATEVEADQYFGLKGNEFVKVNAGTIAAGKAVLPVGVLPAGVKSLTFNFNGVPTGVNGFETVDAENARIFNLAGQRLSAPQKGLNIVNGKKVLVK